MKTGQFIMTAGQSLNYPEYSIETVAGSLVFGVLNAIKNSDFDVSRHLQAINVDIGTLCSPTLRVDFKDFMHLLSSIDDQQQDCDLGLKIGSELVLSELLSNLVFRT